MQVIVFDNGNGVSIIYPTEGADLNQLEKDLVPPGVTKFRVDDANLPDRNKRNLWRINNGIVEIGPENLTEKRLKAKLSRWEFCLTLKKSGLLPRNEAVQAGKGEWPATFAAFVSSLNEDEADVAQMRWADAREVHYADPLLQALALHHTKGDQAVATALLDQLFGI